LSKLVSLAIDKLTKWMYNVIINREQGGSEITPQDRNRRCQMDVFEAMDVSAEYNAKGGTSNA